MSCGIRLHGNGRPRERRAGRTEARLADFLADRVMAVHSSTMLVPRATYAAAGPVDEDIPGGYGEDYEWLLRVAACGPIELVQRAGALPAARPVALPVTTPSDDVLAEVA